MPTQPWFSPNSRGEGVRDPDCHGIRNAGVTRSHWGALRGTEHRRAEQGWKSTEAQARGEPYRSSPSGSTALRSASAAAAIAGHAIRPQSETSRSTRAPPLSPGRTCALLTSHPAGGGGEGERQRFSQSRAGDHRPRPLPRGDEVAGLAQPLELRARQLERRALGLGGKREGWRRGWR